MIAHPLAFGQNVEEDAIENMVGVGRGEFGSSVAEEEVVRFLDAAVEVRREQVGQGVRPVTFYAWHDEQAMQLRFSAARCTPATLPFDARVGDRARCSRDRARVPGRRRVHRVGRAGW